MSNLNFVVYNKHTFEKIGEVRTNHSINLDDAIELLDAERLDHVYSDDPDYRINGKECWYDDLDIDLYHHYFEYISTAKLAQIVQDSDSWDDDDTQYAYKELCNRAGRLLRERVQDGIDCAESFAALRKCAPDEFLADTPDASPDTPDLIDWLRDGAEQAEPEHLTFVLFEILKETM